jgi:hypothetical protein
LIGIVLCGYFGDFMVFVCVFLRIFSLWVVCLLCVFL